jgi:hypothetical protein
LKKQEADSPEPVGTAGVTPPADPLRYAQQNVQAAFDLSQKLIRARDPQEAIALQSEYLKAQIAGFAAKAGALSAELSAGAALSAGTRVEDESREVLARVRAWAGGEAAALLWYRSQPIPAFGDRTAEALVKSGQAAALRDYLDAIALGGFA